MSVFHIVYCTPPISPISTIPNVFLQYLHITQISTTTYTHTVYPYYTLFIVLPNNSVFPQYLTYLYNISILPKYIRLGYVYPQYVRIPHCLSYSTNSSVFLQYLHITQISMYSISTVCQYSPIVYHIPPNTPVIQQYLGIPTISTYTHNIIM